MANPDLWATGEATYCTDPEHSGYWEYCYEVSWIDLPHGVSHLDVIVLLDECECACSTGYFAFDDTCGYGPGTMNGPLCTVFYHGLFSCYGDPSVDLETPLVKFEPYENGCEPDRDGFATICFYAVAEPLYGVYADVVGIKFGQEWATGDLDGPLPGCNTGYSGANTSLWGGIKALYR
jgi:hypothetical protein